MPERRSARASGRGGSMTGATRSRPKPLSRKALVIAAVPGVLLAWQVIAVSLGAGQDDRNTDYSASSFAGQSEVAAITASGQRLDDHDPAGASVMAKRALAISPVSAEALRDFGIAEQGLGHFNTAAAVLSQAAGLGWRDRPTQLWLAQAYLRSGDIESAAQRIDALMRTDPQPTALYEMLDQLVADPRFAVALARRLALGPNWRSNYLRYTTDATETAMEARRQLLAQLARTGSPPNREEIAGVTIKLYQLGRQKDARLLWFDAKHQKESPVADPTFAATRTGWAVPYEWTIQPVAGATLDTGDTSSGGIRITTDGSASGILMRQATALSAGPHSLFYAGTVPPGTRSTIGWKIRCSTSGQYLFNSLEDAHAPPYRFEIPADCPNQQIELYVASNPASANATVRFDSLDVR